MSGRVAAVAESRYSHRMISVQQLLPQRTAISFVAVVARMLFAPAGLRAVPLLLRGRAH